MQSAIIKVILPVICIALSTQTAFAVITPNSKNVLLDKCGDVSVSRWRGCSDSYAFGVTEDWGGNSVPRQKPSTLGSLNFVSDPSAGRCIRLDYDFSKGGQTVYAMRPLEIGMSDVLSFRIRQNGKNPIYVLVQDSAGQAHSALLRISGKGWQNVSIPLSSEEYDSHWTGAKDKQIHFPLKYVGIGVQADSTKKGSLFFNNVSANTADESLFQNITFKSKYPGNIAFTSKQKTSISVIVHNGLPDEVKRTLSITTEDWHGVLKTLPPVELSMAPYGSAEFSVPIDTRLPEYYKITVEVLYRGKSVTSYWTGFVVTSKPRNFGIDDPNAYFGLNSSFRAYPGLTGPIDSNGVQIITHENAARLERIGAKWIRVWFPPYNSWWWGESQQEVLRVPDLKQYRANHLLLMYVLHAAPPEWAIGMYRKPDSKESGSEIKNVDGLFWESDGWEGRSDLWSSYCERVSHALSPYVECFDIENEPDLACTWVAGLDARQGSIRYNRLLEAAVKGVRKGAPNSLISGFSVTGGEYGGDSLLGLSMTKTGKTIDVFGGHPYAGVRFFGQGKEAVWPIGNDELGRCRASVEMMKKYNPEMRYWIGEKGWALDVKADPLSVYSRDFAKCLAQSMSLCHSVPGVDRFGWFDDQGCSEYGYEYGVFRDGKPLPAALAYSVLANMLYHAKPFKSIDFKNTMQAHCFTSTDSAKGTLVLWTDGDKLTVHIPGIPIEYDVYDVMGKLIKSAHDGKSISMELDSSPVYLRFHAGAEASICGNFAKSEVEYSVAVKLENAYLTSIDAVKVQLHNRSSLTNTSEVSVAGAHKQVSTDKGETVTVTMPISSNLTINTKKNISVDLKTKDTVSSIQINTDLIKCPRIVSPVLDGDLTAWEKLPCIVLNQRSQVLPGEYNTDWRGPDDLSVKAWPGWDDKYLYLTAEVHDDIHFTPNPVVNNYWNSDCLAVAVDPLNDAAHNPGYNPDDVEYGMVLAEDGPKVYMNTPRLEPSSIPSHISQHGQEIVYQIAIPWDILGGTPKAGKVFGFNFSVFDNDGKGVKCWIGLSSGIMEGKRPSAFRRFYLSE